MKLILAGFKNQDAWKRFHSWMYEMKRKKIKSVIILTSKDNFKKIPVWCENVDCVDKIYPHMTGDGYWIKLKIK